jgi:hypothetical protein
MNGKNDVRVWYLLLIVSLGGLGFWGLSKKKKSFEGHREYFLGKSVKRIAKEMEKHGYKVRIEDSRHKFSKAKRIVVLNPSKERNVSVVQVSPGSRRHGDTAYVKVSTTNEGKYKIVSKKELYISDGKETAKIYYPRRKRK